MVNGYIKTTEILLVQDFRCPNLSNVDFVGLSIIIISLIGIAMMKYMFADHRINSICERLPKPSQFLVEIKT